MERVGGAGNSVLLMFSAETCTSVEDCVNSTSFPSLCLYKLPCVHLKIFSLIRFLSRPPFHLPPFPSLLTPSRGPSHPTPFQPLPLPSSLPPSHPPWGSLTWQSLFTCPQVISARFHLDASLKIVIQGRLIYRLPLGPNSNTVLLLIFHWSRKSFVSARKIKTKMRRE